MVDQPQFARLFLDDDMTAFAVSVVAQQVEKHNRFQAGLIFITEIEVVIIWIVFNKLLDRARAVGAIFA